MTHQPKRIGRPAMFDRAAVLETAMGLFWKHGYEGTHISMLTEAMGLSPPSLYASFGSKQALYEEALHLYGPTALPGAGPVHSQLKEVLKSAAGRFTDPSGPKGCMLLTGSLRSGQDGLGAVQAAAEVRQKQLDLIIDWLSRAQVQGEISSEADVPSFAHFYLAVLQGMSIQAVDGIDAATLHRIADIALSAWPGLPADA